MTSLHVVDVAAAIAALTIRGVTIYDLDQMPVSLTGRPLPVLMPTWNEPFISDWQNTRITLQGNVAMVYTLNYTLYRSPVGSGRGLFDRFPDLLATVQTVVDAFNAITRVDGCKRLELAALPQVGLVLDPSEQQYHGARLGLRVTEF